MKRKHFYVVTYDIGDDKRRNKVVKLLEGIGTRMNFSVFECMLTDIQYRNMCNQLAKIIVKKEDWVNIYPLCTECYARITYIPLCRLSRSLFPTAQNVMPVSPIYQTSRKKDPLRLLSFESLEQCTHEIFDLLIHILSQIICEKTVNG